MAESGWKIPFPVLGRPSASPFPPESETNDRATSKDASPDGIPTILVVEDNPTDIFVIRDILRECNLNEHVEVARNGQEALSFLGQLGAQERQPCPRLVLLDLNLPGIDGIEVLKQIRAGTRCGQCPVIIITSSESERDRRAVRELNADAYFRKPASLTAYLELGKVILRVLELREKDQPLR